jgi:hypothetical protein
MADLGFRHQQRRQHQRGVVIAVDVQHARHIGAASYDFVEDVALHVRCVFHCHLRPQPAGCGISWVDANLARTAMLAAKTVRVARSAEWGRGTTDVTAGNRPSQREAGTGRGPADQ